MQVSLGQQAASRSRIVRELTHLRSQGPYRVLDLGGQPGGWSDSVVDLYVNTNWPDSDRVLSRDLCLDSTWHALDQYVALHGVFDYCICTHTLEDLVYPFALLDRLGLWARSGFIAVPSLRTELSHPESTDYLGFCHHLWLIDADQNQLEFTPKLAVVNQVSALPFLRSVEELQIAWHGGVAYTQIGARGWESPQQVRDWLAVLAGRAGEQQG